MSNRPVLLYNRAWLLNFETGVCPIGYLNYEWMYGDATHPIRDVVAANPSALVVMPTTSFESLRRGRYEEDDPGALDLLRRIGLITSTVHYRQGSTERRIKDELWRNGVGSMIRDSHVELARFGRYVVIGAPVDANAPR